MRFIKSLTALSLTLFTWANGLNAQELTATLQFQIEPVTTCASEGICLPVSEYRVYVVGGGLLGTSNTSQLETAFTIVLGQEYCFEATAYNGIESNASEPACETWSTEQPSAPIIIDIPIVVN